MVEFRHVGTFTDGADKILTNISDLSLMVSDGQAFLLTASHAGGALAGFRLGDAEALPVFQRAIFYPSTALHLHSPVISNLELPGGDIALLSGLRLGAPLAARVTEGGLTGGLTGFMPGVLEPGIFSAESFSTADGDFMLVAQMGHLGFDIYRIGANGAMTWVSAAEPPTGSPLADASLDVVRFLQIGDETMAVSASGLGNFLAVHRSRQMGR